MELQGCFHEITERLRLAGISAGHLAKPPTPAGTPRELAKFQSEGDLKLCNNFHFLKRPFFTGQEVSEAVLNAVK